MSRELHIFISHKMPKDSALSNELGAHLALYGGNSIKVLSAEDFKAGTNIENNITNAISRANMFVLLYTGEEENWNYCLMEAGKFLALTEGDKSRQIVVIHHPDIRPPAPLSQFLSVPVTTIHVKQFLENIFKNEPWAINPILTEEILEDNANEIVDLFNHSTIVPINFDLVPSFSISFSSSNENMSAIAKGNIPESAVFVGTQGWEVLFERSVSTGAWTWDDLVKKWKDRELYEFEIARMIKSGMNKDAPEGCYIRPEGNNKLYRLILRRYEETESAGRLKFYFTASPLDIPVFGIGDTASKKELLLYHLLNISWYTRRRLVDILYWKVYSRINSARTDLQEDLELVDDIKNELISIDIQAVIRRITDPADVEEVLDPSIGVEDQRQWLKLKEEIFQHANASPPDLKSISEALFRMATMNERYYKICSQSFAQTAQQLPEIRKILYVKAQ
ncbi:TIR domain-containing protein [Rhizobium ruizarguesonis]|uniref:toll/interleukin-1 receptor domain-containing protein n=1 Tax=Rhizobium ruizarguesonis TaxID=2081791 RepID=UPI001030DD59|nr:toll/interleukin-1 receptor domain-containing protein [Rhizobium ruizarguesonis]TBB38499.1 TIR domain-containing protein [Rhizobium ruizarguesonis]